MELLISVLSSPLTDSGVDGNVGGAVIITKFPCSALSSFKLSMVKPFMPDCFRGVKEAKVFHISRSVAVRLYQRTDN